MSLQSLSSSAERWLGARRRALPGAPEVEPVPISMMIALFLVGLYFVVDTFDRLLCSPDLGLSPLEVAGVIVVATAAGLVYSRVVAWLDRNEKEPWRLMVSVLLLGAIAGFGVANGVTKLLKSDLESLLEKPPLNETEYHVLFPDSSRQVLKIDCDRPEVAIDVLRQMEWFDEAEQLDGMVFVVSGGIAEYRPLILQKLTQADVQVRHTRVYTSSQNFFEKGAWLVVRDRLWDNVRPKRIAPLVEEATKGLLVLLLFIGLQREFDGPLDGIVYGALVGLGFAVTENAVYMIGKGFRHQFLTRIMLRGLAGHATYTALTGLGLGIARTAQKRSMAPGTGAARTSQHRTVATLSPIIGFVLAVAAHMIWNSLNRTFATGWWDFIRGVLVLNVPFTAMVGVGLWLSLRQEDAAVLHYLPVDMYDPASYTARPDFASARARYQARRRAARTIGRKKARLVHQLQRTLIEIAFWLWYAARENLDSNTIPELAALRRRVLDLRVQITADSKSDVAI